MRNRNNIAANAGLEGRTCEERLHENDATKRLKREGNVRGRRLQLTSAPLHGGWMVKINPQRSLKLND